VQNAKLNCKISYLNVLRTVFAPSHGVLRGRGEALAGAALLTGVNFSLTEKALLDQENRASFTLQA
jgi:hypothetical protein